MPKIMYGSEKYFVIPKESITDEGMKKYLEDLTMKESEKDDMERLLVLSNLEKPYFLKVLNEVHKEEIRIERQKRMNGDLR